MKAVTKAVAGASSVSAAQSASGSGAPPNKEGRIHIIRVSVNLKYLNTCRLKARFYQLYCVMGPILGEMFNIELA